MAYNIYVTYHCDDDDLRRVSRQGLHFLLKQYSPLTKLKKDTFYEYKCYDFFSEKILLKTEHTFLIIDTGVTGGPVV